MHFSFRKNEQFFRQTFRFFADFSSNPPKSGRSAHGFMQAAVVPMTRGTSKMVKLQEHRYMVGISKSNPLKGHIRRKTSSAGRILKKYGSAGHITALKA